MESKIKVEKSRYHGKSGKGLAKTKTIRVIEDLGSHYLIKKQFRYNVGDTDSYLKALKKANKFAEELKKTN